MNSLFRSFAVGFVLSFFFYFYSPRTALGDKEAGNWVYVRTSEGGQFYAKSIPSESYGTSGITKIFQVGKDQDTLIQTYNWYSREIFIEGFTGTASIYVVQSGPWTRGHQAAKEDLALAFYKNDRLLKKYSTLDIAGQSENVIRSAGHYTVIKRKIGFRRPFGNQLVFDVEKEDGQILSFDTETGEIFQPAEEAIKKNLYEVETQIGQIKWKWYESHKAQIPDVNNYVITEKDLREVAPNDFPHIPEGYEYKSDSIWKPIQFNKKNN